MITGNPIGYADFAWSPLAGNKLAVIKTRGVQSVTDLLIGGSVLIVPDLTSPDYDDGETIPVMTLSESHDVTSGFLPLSPIGTFLTANAIQAIVLASSLPNPFPLDPKTGVPLPRSGFAVTAYGVPIGAAYAAPAVRKFSMRVWIWQLFPDVLDRA